MALRLRLSTDLPLSLLSKRNILGFLMEFKGRISLPDKEINHILGIDNPKSSLTCFCTCTQGFFPVCLSSAPV